MSPPGRRKRFPGKSRSRGARPGPWVDTGEGRVPAHVRGATLLRKGRTMLAGPDLLVILGIALVVFGPQKLPELTKTLGRALMEFRKTTEEVKESLGGELIDLVKMRGHLTGVDLLVDLAEKLSATMPSEEKAVPDSVDRKPSEPGAAKPD